MLSPRTSCLKLAGSIFLLSTLVACTASIPRESVALSRQVGDGISASERSHTHLINTYFRMKSAQLDAWIENEYLPEYVRNVQALLKKSGKSEALSPEQIRDILKDIIAERDSKQADLERTRQFLLDKISTHYADLSRANAGVTALLQSAVNVRDAGSGVSHSLSQLSGSRIDLEQIEQQFNTYLKTTGAAASKATSLLENVRKVYDKQGG